MSDKLESLEYLENLEVGKILENLKNLRNLIKKNKFLILKINTLTPCAFFLRTSCEHILRPPQKVRRNPLQDHFSLKINEYILRI